VEHHQFSLDVASTSAMVELQVPEASDLLWAGFDGIVLASGATDHYARVRAEAWPQEPAEPDQVWDEQQEGIMTVDSPELVLRGATGVVSDEVLTLPAPGKYRVRAHCGGRAAAADAVEAWAEESDADPDADFPTGHEQWLIQIWPE
jgi:hypothetical protein